MDTGFDQEIVDIVADCDAWRFRGSGADGRYHAVTQEERMAMLDRQDRVLAQVDLDPDFVHVADFETHYLINALFCDDLRMAGDLAERRCPPDAVARGEVMVSAHQVQSMAVCVWAVLEKDDTALALMEALGREGDNQFWRFDIFTERQGMPFAASGMDRWLDRLARIPRYQAILDRYLPQWVQSGDRFEYGPLRMVEDATLGGKAKKKCVLTGEKIEPDAPVIRFRRAFEGEVNDMQMAARDAFEGSPLNAARRAFEANAVPLAEMFPPPAMVRDLVRAPHDRPVLPGYGRW